MLFSKKVVTLILSLTLLASLSTAACKPSPSGETPPANQDQPPPPARLTKQEILANVQAASASVKTASFGANATITIEVTGGNSPGTMPMSMDLTAQMDAEARALRMTSTVKVDIPGLGEQRLPMEMYILGGWMYTKAGIPGLGEQWVKTRFDEQEWESQDQLAQQFEFLATAANVTLEREETVDGIDSYVLLVYPDPKALGEWVSKQQSSNVDLSKVDLAEVFKAISIRQWVAKDTFLPVRAAVYVVLELSPGDVGATASDFDKMTMKMDAAYRFLDYNKPVTIVLPEGANSATEAPVSP